MWFFVIGLVAALAISIALIPRPNKRTTPEQGRIQGASAEEGKSIPVLFGTREISSQNIVWYGDIKTEPVKQSS